MEIVKSIKVTYPTVTYGSIDLFTSVKVGESDIPIEYQNLPADQKFQVMNQKADDLVTQGYYSEHQRCQQHMLSALIDILPPEVTAHLVQQGRIKK